MKKLLHENGLSIVMFGLFLLFLMGQSLAGFRVYNQEQEEHGQSAVSYGQYLTTGHFAEAVFENWESEFLQIGSYIFLTAFLYQKGSAESKPLQGLQPVDKISRKSSAKNAPWPVRRGGWVLKMYSHSLSLAFLIMFLITFFLHGVYGSLHFNEAQIEHGSATLSMGQYMVSSTFWFESFQNWQSEFLSIGLLVVLSIFLRQRGSPESKPVDHPHGETGSE